MILLYNRQQRTLIMHKIKNQRHLSGQCLSLYVYIDEIMSQLQTCGFQDLCLRLLNGLYLSNQTVYKFKLRQSNIQMSLKQERYDLDWYSLYKINPQNPNFNQFHKILSSASITVHQLQNVPISHRKNLLTLFQSVDTRLIQQKNIIQANKQSLLAHKRAISQQTSNLEQQLQVSLAEIKVFKQEITQKRKILKKLKAKKQKKQEYQKIKAREIETKYYCPFCERQQFNSKEVFKFHVFSHNPQMLQNNKGNASEAVLDQMKEFMLTMKDKQMEIMNMILKDKRQSDMKQMERMYEREMEKFHQGKNNRPQGISIYQKDLQQGELSGQSQYYFFSQSRQRQQIQQLRQRQRFIYGKPEQSYHKQYRNQNKEATTFNKTYTVGDTGNRSDEVYNYNLNEEQKYFNCPSLKEPITNVQYNRYQPIRQPSNYKTHNYFTSDAYLDEQLGRKQQNAISKQHSNFKYSHSKNKNNKSTEQLHLNLKSNREAVGSRQPLNSTIYYEDKSHTKIFGQSQMSISQKDTHVFNAGVMIDDSGSQSDYQDYFYPTKDADQDNQIDDQQIIVDAQIMVRDISTLRKNKDSIFNSDQRIQFNNFQNEKSESCIVDLSEDSIQQSAKKKNRQKQPLARFQPSSNHDVSFKSLKNDSSHQYSYSISMTSEEQVNLSDLRISKLPVKKEENKLQQSHRQSIKKVQCANQQENALDRVRNFSKKKKAENSEISVIDSFKRVDTQKKSFFEGIVQQKSFRNNQSSRSNQRKQNFRQQNIRKQKKGSDSILSQFFKPSHQKITNLDEAIQSESKIGNSQIQSVKSSYSRTKFNQEMEQTKGALDQFMIKK